MRYTFIILLEPHVFSLEITEMLPSILNQLGPESLTHLKKLANNVTSQYKAADDDDVPGSYCIQPNFLFFFSKKLIGLNTLKYFRVSWRCGF